MFYRTVDIEFGNIPRLCDADGKLIRFHLPNNEAVVFSLFNPGPPPELTDDVPGNWEAWSEAYGGITEGLVIPSADGRDCIVLVCNDGMICLNIDYQVVNGELTQWNG